jgi:ATP phosphoribosyltransferase
MTIRIALPTGNLRASTLALLNDIGLGFEEYQPGSRVMRSPAAGRPLAMRIFRERDIPVQMAIGNYDLGICGDVFVAEHKARFPLERVVRLGTLPGPTTELWLAAAPSSGLEPGSVPAGASVPGAVIAGEYPNLADLVAIRLRIPRYRVLHVAGAVDVYPPVDADLVIVEAASAEAVQQRGLVPLHRVFRGGVALFANGESLARRNLAGVLERFRGRLSGDAERLDLPRGNGSQAPKRESRDRSLVRIAVPDGHAQRYAPGILRAAGIGLFGYDEDSGERCPAATDARMQVRVVRPQDMPQLVALGAFDLAISGRDLLHEHLCRFPSSPVRMAVDLQANRYRFGPVVDAAFPADTTAEAVALWNALGRPVRIASEFPATAERFAQDHHLRYTSIIPVAGASEGFVPEDADMLVEGTETGTSIRANGLKMLDPFMESTSCVLVRSQPATTQTRLLDDLVDRFAAVARSSP